MELSDDREQLRLYCSSALTERGSYLRDSVLLEFGGWNITEPNETHVVRPDVAIGVAELLFPKEEVSALAPACIFMLIVCALRRSPRETAAPDSWRGLGR